MPILKAKKTFYDQYGRPCSPTDKLRSTRTKQYAMGLYGNIWDYRNAGRYQRRYYTLNDTEQGLDALSRELLVRWSREMVGQLPIVDAAIRILARFSVGAEYNPEYIGENSEWGKEATDWLKQEFYPNCCTRGKNYDFKAVLKLISCAVDTDGDILCIWGKNKNGFPKFQFIPSHRVRTNNIQYGSNLSPYTDALPDTFINDGIVQKPDGEVIGWNVVNYENLVNQSYTPQLVDKFISVNSARLLFEARYFDKARGIPSIGSAILQALSIQELDQYLMDKLKIESMVGLIEKNASGEGYEEFADTLAGLERDMAQVGQAVPPSEHGLTIAQSPDIRFVRSDGGEIVTLNSNTPANESAQYMNRLESQVLSTLGVPHSLVYSSGDISGRATSAPQELFNASIDERQELLDKIGKYMIGYSLAVAMKKGLISPNKKENVMNIFNLTHPKDFTLNAGYERSADLADVAAGLKTVGAVCEKNGTSYDELIVEQEKEQTAFYSAVNRVSKETNTPQAIVIQGWRKSITTIPLQTAEAGGGDSSQNELVPSIVGK